MYYIPEDFGKRTSRSVVAKFCKPFECTDHQFVKYLDWNNKVNPNAEQTAEYNKYKAANEIKK